MFSCSAQASWGPGLQLHIVGLPPAGADDAMQQDDAFTTTSSVAWWDCSTTTADDMQASLLAGLLPRPWCLLVPLI